METSLAVARALEDRLWGVRLDTSEFMVDRSVIPQMGAFRPTGVNPPLVWNVRNALDAEGFGDVKIVVSGGFDVARIRAFEEDGVPVDAYGVGASAARGPLGLHRRRRPAGRQAAGEGGARVAGEREAGAGEVSGGAAGSVRFSVRRASPQTDHRQPITHHRLARLPLGGASVPALHRDSHGRPQARRRRHPRR